MMIGEPAQVVFAADGLEQFTNAILVAAAALTVKLGEVPAMAAGSVAVSVVDSAFLSVMEAAGRVARPLVNVTVAG